jgi:hypothetical protein
MKQYKYNMNPANKQKIRARRTVNDAIRRGKLLRQPCAKCGALKANAHHHDYSKPLDIQWLCSPCHGEEHRLSHCKRGHALTDDNVRISRTRGTRACKTCEREQSRKYWQIHKRSEWQDSRRAQT